MLIRIFIFLICSLLVINNLQAQKILQFDATNSGKSKVKFFIGDLLKFKIKGGKGWYEYTITDMDERNQELIFDEIRIPVSQISELFHIRKSSKHLAMSCASLSASFGLGWTVFSIVGLIAKSPAVKWTHLLIGAVALIAAACFFFIKAFWVRRTKMTEKHRLRIVDLSFKKDNASSANAPLSPIALDRFSPSLLNG